jgi:hypothetical protein
MKHTHTGQVGSDFGIALKSTRKKSGKKRKKIPVLKLNKGDFIQVTYKPPIYGIDTQT